MMPRTLHKLDPMACLSAMQKCVRRGMEREAMEFACELCNTSKAFCSMVANRLELISHEDIDCISQPHVVPFVRTCGEQAREWWTAEKPAKSRMAIGNAIRMMCRAAKSREGDHFNGAIGIPNQFFNVAPKIPDWAYDHHTTIGRRQGRGMDYFRTESTKLVPPQATPDEYENEFYAWQEKRMEAQATGVGTNEEITGSLFD